MTSGIDRVSRGPVRDSLSLLPSACRKSPINTPRPRLILWFWPSSQIVRSSLLSPTSFPSLFTWRIWLTISPKFGWSSEADLLQATRSLNVLGSGEYGAQYSMRSTSTSKWNPTRGSRKVDRRYWMWSHLTGSPRVVQIWSRTWMAEWPSLNSARYVDSIVKLP